jgi:hypothetical protein
MFDTVWFMDEILELLESAATAATDLVCLCTGPVSQRAGLLALQSHLDKVGVAQAKLLAAAEASKAHEGTGARNSAGWLSDTSKSSFGSARKKAELGKTLSKSKTLDDAVADGSVSPDAAAALHDAVTNPPENATDDDVDSLVDAVKGADPREAKQAADRWRETFGTETEEEAEERRYQNRSLRMTAPCDGQVTINATLPTLQARQVYASINHVAGEPYEGDTRTNEQRLADGLVELACAYAKGEVSGGRENPNLLITIAIDSLTGDGNEPGVTSWGDRIPAHVVRRLAEHADLQRVITAGSLVLDLGRSVRCATTDQYRALVVRDGGCRWPGCAHPPAWCQIDHLHDWILGGPTDLDLLAMWCTHHHHERHRPGVKVHGNANDLRLQLRDGTIIHCPPNTGGASFRTREPVQADLFGGAPPGRTTQAAA